MRDAMLATRGFARSVLLVLAGLSSACGQGTAPGLGPLAAETAREPARFTLPIGTDELELELLPSGAGAPELDVLLMLRLRSPDGTRRVEYELLAEHVPADSSEPIALHMDDRPMYQVIPAIAWGQVYLDDRPAELVSVVRVLGAEEEETWASNG